MLDSVQIRRRGALNFEGYYDHACATQGLAPLPSVKANLSRGMLDFNGDLVSLSDWTPILASLSINKHLQHIAIRSSYLSNLGSQGLYQSSIRKKIPAVHSKAMTLQLCKAMQKCLSLSACLKTLHLQGLPLRERDLIILTKGIAKSVSLESLSLAHCPIADEGLEVICQSVKYSSSIRTVDFSCCNITWRGAEHMTEIIKHQAVRRHSVAWAESLRYRKPEFEVMGGLRRITLNGNILIGDRGVTALAQELTEDLWVKAVDLQRCGISNEGAQVLLDMLKTNRTVCVLDIRRNPLVDNEMVKAVIKHVLMNTKSQDSQQYLWIKPPANKDPPKHSSLRRGGTTGKGKSTFRIGPQRRSSTSGTTKRSRPGSVGYVPWRTAARASKQRGPPPGLTAQDHSFQNATSVRVTVETESESEEAESDSEIMQRIQGKICSSQHSHLQTQCNRLQVELEECRLRLAEERKARLEANSRLVELELENNRLRALNRSLSEVLQAPNQSSSVLEDDKVLDSIEASFQKFHAFLDLLKDAGLGQLASMAGIHQSDFGLVGRPQFSSTQRREVAGVTDSTQDKDEDVARGDGPSMPSGLQSGALFPGDPDFLKDSGEQSPPAKGLLLTTPPFSTSPAPPEDPEREMYSPPSRGASDSEGGGGGGGGGGGSGVSNGRAPGSDRSACSLSSRSKGSGSRWDDGSRSRSSHSVSSKAPSLSQNGGAFGISPTEELLNGSGLAWR